MFSEVVMQIQIVFILMKTLFYIKIENHFYLNDKLSTEVLQFFSPHH